MATRYAWMADTDPKAFEVLLDLQRRMSPGEKLAAVFELSAFLMGLAEENERHRRPQAGERELFLRAAARRLDRQTMIRAYGWDPEAAP